MELGDMPQTATSTYAPTIATLDSPTANRAPWSEPHDLYSLVPYPEDYWARAEERRCFARDESNVQITWTDVNERNHASVRRLGSWAELHAHSAHSTHPANGLRVISISQSNSWRPLNVNRRILQQVLSITNASSEVLEYPLGFCQKSLDVEEAFSSAPLLKSNDKSIEIAYVMKYASRKCVEEMMDPWVIRQTGVYQKIDKRTKQTTWIFFHPSRDCLFQLRLAHLLQSPDQCAAFKQQPLLIHNVLFGTFFPLWRDYLAYYEKKVLTISNITMAQRMDEELRINHETLGSIRHTENRCLCLRPIFQSLQKTFDVLHHANNELAEHAITTQSEVDPMRQLLNNYLNAVDAYSQNAWFLQERTARIATSLRDTLSFKDSNTAKVQSKYMLDLTLSTVDDSTTVRVITIVTLVYLPSTFMATLLGMNSFFEMNPDDHRLVVSPQFWIYIVCSIPLTMATLLYWWLFQRTRQRMKMRNKEALVA